MEQERIAREAEEKERAERMKKIKEQFTDPNSQWEKDKTDIQNIAAQEKAKEQSAPAEDGKSSGSTSPALAQQAAAEKRVAN